MPPSTLTMNQRELERAQVTQAGEQLERTLSWMRFPGELEEQFLKDGAERRLTHFMVSGWLALVVFLGFLLVDYLMVRDVLWLAVQVRVFVFLPPALIVLVAGTFARSWTLRHGSPLIMETVVLFSGIGAAGSLAYILAASHSPMSQYYHAGLMVVIIYGNIVQRLRFWYAVLFSLGVYVIHLGGILMMAPADPRLVLPLAALIGATVGLTLMANYAMERDERRQYLLSLRRKLVLEDLGDVHERLQRLSRVDGLTGVYNRRHVEGYLRQVWQRAQHGGEELAVIMVDVDHFKSYNDRYGHLMGDHCLIQVALTMQESLRRPGDVVARLGGEEFVAVLPQAGAEVAHAAAERLRHAVERLAMPHQASSVGRCVTVSVGVAHAAPQPGQDAAQLLARADQALYEAKRKGRNRVASASV